jgi:hypothetical protein
VLERAAPASRISRRQTASVDVGQLSTVVPRRPPFTTRFGFVRAKSRSDLATAAASPLTKATAVGPTNSSSLPSTPNSRAAKRTRVFL